MINTGTIVIFKIVVIMWSGNQVNGICIKGEY